MPNTVERKHSVRDRLLEIATSPKYDGGRPMNDPVDDELVAFLERALQEAVEMLAENRFSLKAGVNGPTVADYEAVDGLLSSDNIEEIDVRDRGRFHAPKVTVWLHQSAVEGKRWANSADRREFKFSERREHYNGDPTLAIIDVRPF